VRFDAKALVLDKGHYGPFKDDAGTAREGRTIPYLTLVDAENGGEPIRATLSSDTDPATLPAAMQTADLSLELTTVDGKLKLRCHGPATPARAARAA
jgi:hypothetical protein